ncbi:putative RNA methyltransferase At5g10620 isoform X2 [Euphorbia lathyris]|uniref:putative RNA methyltransferase At5g10620 isoform X2 n=1 Tax=Euphorbia lathyris TaxID=212925 RepID=UPI003313829B
MAISTCSGFHINNCFCALASGRQCKYSGQSVRALPTRIITVGKKRSPGVQLLVEEYIGKLKYYTSIDDIQIRSNPKNARDDRAQVDDEDLAVMKLMTSDDWGASRLSFCIGGPYGHGQRIRKRANVSIRLSSMVLNHQIALLVLIEQLYRSWTILKGQNYHH